MKTFLLIFCIISLGNTVPFKGPPINSNAIILQFFEMLKYYIKNGYPEKGLPVMDPLVFHKKELDMNAPEKILSLKATFENITITGLGCFDLKETEFIKEDISIKINVNYPAITIQSERYAMEGDFYEVLPVGGRGKFEFEIYNLAFSGKIFLKQSDDDKSILFKSVLFPRYSIEKIISNTEFDGNIDDIINEIITDNLADYLTRFNQFVIKNQIQNVITVINQFLGNFDSWRLLATIL